MDERVTTGQALVSKPNYPFVFTLFISRIWPSKTKEKNVHGPGDVLENKGHQGSLFFQRGVFENFNLEGVLNVIIT